MADFDEEVRKHNQKWQKWIGQLQNQNYSKPQQKKQVKGDTAYNYTVNLINKIGDQKSSLSKGQRAVQKQFENNVCYICAQIMLPPKKPIILFPCSHNICQLCIYQNGQTRQRKYQLKFPKCPKCNKKIDNHAPNWNLMTLLCSFTGNKQLLDQQLKMKNSLQDEQQQEKYENLTTDHLQKMRIRCDILRAQKYNLDKQITKDTKNLSILEKALEQMQKQQIRNKQQMDKLREEKKLIKKFLHEKQKDLEKIQITTQETQHKQKVVMKTIEPLRRQIQKMKILDAAKNL